METGAHRVLHGQTREQRAAVAPVGQVDPGSGQRPATLPGEGVSGSSCLAVSAQGYLNLETALKLQAQHYCR